jgi:phage host-nuclease inhibitor protein Gam
MLNLIDTIKTIKDKINNLETTKNNKIAEITDKYNKEIEQYKTALEVNMKLNEACISCKGEGWIKRTVGYDDTDSFKCEKCNGTGKI